jgi:phosphatidylinositol 4-kinase
MCRWSDRVFRVATDSPHSSLPSWQLRHLIIKSGDDCRQELLALQLITEAAAIWSSAGLPLWVRPFELLVTSNTTALMEVIPDAFSVHSIKARSAAAAAEAGGGAAAGVGWSGSSLTAHFFDMWGPVGSARCSAAQRRFTESLAGYSLLSYLLQVRRCGGGLGFRYRVLTSGEKVGRRFVF